MRNEGILILITSLLVAISACSSRVPTKEGSNSPPDLHDLATTSATVRVLGQNEPVPDGYVITPAGYVHSSCIHLVPHGTKVRSDGTALKGDQVVAQLEPWPCPYPRLQMGKIQHENNDGGEPPSSNHAFEATCQNTVASSPFTLVFASLTVPPLPSNDGQVVYYWIGLQGGANSFLFQPVLQYGNERGVLGGGNYWCLQNVEVGPGGLIAFGDPPCQQVYPGDPIDMEIVLYGTSGTCSATGGGSNCYQDWELYIADYKTGTYLLDVFELLPGQSEGNEPFFAIPSALEFWNINQCSDVPSSVTLSNIELATGTYNPPTFGVTPFSPNCTYGGTPTPPPTCAWNMSGTSNSETISW